MPRQYYYFVAENLGTDLEYIYPRCMSRIKMNEILELYTPLELEEMAVCCMRQPVPRNGRTFTKVPDGATVEKHTLPDGTQGWLATLGGKQQFCKERYNAVRWCNRRLANKITRRGKCHTLQPQQSQMSCDAPSKPPQANGSKSTSRSNAQQNQTLGTVTPRSTPTRSPSASKQPLESHSS